ncbi:MAG TPA: DUF1284 domain-containing protein [Armatimonadota bacterium]|jgi:hypothetical protein
MVTVEESKRRVIKLRGHHLLCVFGFRGYGYSAEFVREMARIVLALRAPGTRVEIVAGVDDICCACPKRASGACARPESPRDRAVLAVLALPVGHVAAAATLFRSIARRVSGQQLTELCASCSWYDLGYCAEGLTSGRIAAGWRAGDPAGQDNSIETERGVDRDE